MRILLSLIIAVAMTGCYKEKLVYVPQAADSGTVEGILYKDCSMVPDAGKRMTLSVSAQTGANSVHYYFVDYTDANGLFNIPYSVAIHPDGQTMYYSLGAENVSRGITRQQMNLPVSYVNSDSAMITLTLDVSNAYGPTDTLYYYLGTANVTGYVIGPFVDGVIGSFKTGFGGIMGDANNHGAFIKWAVGYNNFKNAGSPPTPSYQSTSFSRLVCSGGYTATLTVD